jgi:hypothetical protein
MAALVVFVALLYAATAPTSKPLRWYLAAQMAYLAAVWPMYYWLGNDLWAYTLTYGVLTAVCLVPVVLIAIFALPHHEDPVSTIIVPPVVSTIILVLASFGIHHPSAGVCLQVAEAFILVGAGTLLGFCAPFYESSASKTSALTLSVLWLLQAAFRYCYVMHIGVAGWETANEVIPPMLMVGACLWLGRRLRVLAPRSRTQLVYQ